MKGLKKMKRETKDNIMKKLKSLSNPQAVAGMARYGIIAEKAYGISIPDLRKIAKSIGIEHELAQQLWSTGIHEARILASMIDDPEIVTEKQMEEWVKYFDNWEICDQCCMNLFWRTHFANQKAVEWCGREEEYVKRGGFAMIACLAWKNKKAEDALYENFLPIIQREADDNRKYVKKSANWALRNIGKRNQYLNRKAIETAKEIQKIDSKSAKWIASDAIRELTSEKIQKRLRK